jgi:hypothetical protein
VATASCIKVEPICTPSHKLLAISSQQKQKAEC